MKAIVAILLMVLGLPLFGQIDQTNEGEEPRFFPEGHYFNQQPGIEWGTLTLPENWDHPEGRQVTLAYAVIKNTSGEASADALVMIEGGPGAGGLEGMGWFLNHPVRQSHDIIVFDIRGTGFSEPRLCPDLGKELLNILAKDQTPEVDGQEKVAAAMKCRQSMIAAGIDLHAYNSQSITKDLHALKVHLGYQAWNVHSVSFGTHISQLYAQNFPEDVKALILDSPISDINEYYTSNTTNYVTSLQRVFRACEDNPQCNAQFPELERVYQQTLQQLKDHPITVQVDESVVPGGSFTYNAEDFKIAIHQALYHKWLIEVVPLLINQFYEANEQTLGGLVAAFSGALGLDYGVYFCVTCHDVMPRNALSAYHEDVASQGLVEEGLAFYHSDFLVCDEWNKQQNLTRVQADTALQIIDIPTLIITGGADPITPRENGEDLMERITNGHLVDAPTYGHASSFTRIGFRILNDFVNDPVKVIQNDFTDMKIEFVHDVHVNGGISKMGTSISQQDIFFLTPLGIALLISLVAIFIYVITIARRKHSSEWDLTMKVLLIVSSILAVTILLSFVMGLQSTSTRNLYILAFGLPGSYSYAFQLILPFGILLAAAILVMLLSISKMKNRSVTFTVLFSNVLIAIYFMYWGLVF